jgi:hypothetical protein
MVYLAGTKFFSFPRKLVAVVDSIESDYSDRKGPRLTIDGKPLKHVEPMNHRDRAGNSQRSSSARNPSF